LRQWLAREFPASDPFAKKQGFTVPVGAWIAGAAERLAPLVAAQPGVAEIARPDRILPLFRAAAGKREGFAAWHLLFWALWHARHVERRRMQGDVFEALASR
jgi:asparagine synthase (glutamine-hydrolysing)